MPTATSLTAASGGGKGGRSVCRNRWATQPLDGKAHIAYCKRDVGADAHIRPRDDVGIVPYVLK